MADHLEAEQTPGFKVGEKKTMEEYQKLGKPVSHQPSSHNTHKQQQMQII